MSAQPLVFEGPDPEQLLIEAWGKHGTAVRISEPVCVRKGGVLGFFAKLHYRIEVEPLQASTVPESFDRALADASAAAPTPRPQVAQQQPRPAAAAPGTPPAVTTASALEQLVSSTEDVLELQGAGRRSFDQVLHGVASSLGEEPGAYRAAMSAAGRAGTGEPGGTATRTLEGMAASSGDGADDQAPQAGTARITRFEAARAVEVARSAASEAERASRDDPSERAAEHLHGIPNVADQLAAIGFPRALLARVPAPTPGMSDAEAAFSLLSAPSPLPAVTGALVAVVGELGRALEVAGSVAEELRIEDAEIAVASPAPPGFALPSHLLVGDPKRAAALAPGWRRDCTAIVVVDCAAPGATPAWIRSMLRAMRPSATWAVASAAAKHEDVAFFADAIGGVDALVLDDLAGTVTPAAVLAAGIPVARLDGEPATASAWVDAVSHLLTEPTSQHGTTSRRGPAAPRGR